MTPQAGMKLLLLVLLFPFEVSSPSLNHTEDHMSGVFSFSDLAGLRSFLPETEEETRIIGGEEALFHSWPWQVSLTFITMPACGGAILSPFWVLSAAHCFRRYIKASLWTVLAGKHDLDNLNEKGQQVVAVSIILIHKDYSTQTKEYDIALLKLKEPLIFNDFVRPINIWMTTLPLFTECTTTGWGSTRENGPRVNKLQEVNVTLLPSEVCNKYYVGRILDTMFCAGKEEGGADACQGDSGGPISCFNGSRYELAGVVSWGVGCGRAKKPGVYTRIQNVISWITDVINEENILSVGTPAAAEDNCGKHRGRGCVTVPLTASLHQSQDGVTSVQNISESCPFYWPWQVSIQQDGHHYCSGTLISQQFVITAQHCNVRVEDTVVLGLHDIRYSLLQRIPVVRVINLPQDGSFPPGSDLSLIQLATPARLGKSVAPICVPDQDEDGDLDHSWICTVTGWGTTKATGGVNPNRLHHAVVTLFNQTTCREKWGEDMIKDSHLCAHPAASTSCLGDSGAPLFCRKHGAYFLFGIVTWGSSRCDEHFPAVFTRVPRFYSWISDEIGDQGGLQ
ncbi:ovochymase-1 isoform X1 [Periophthalmus magnuspinnatus]|uniref:ovochymase-1 isoform X1 n=1 Tax=Periophthalmus magnuspinnatus TaxID=409849 RepID=UPI0024367648|nr:ovochymase-1 isoform X1 [Periophthalmus magnuspinnatus]